jgi:hypothetical protein
MARQTLRGLRREVGGTKPGGRLQEAGAGMLSVRCRQTLRDDETEVADSPNSVSMVRQSLGFFLQFPEPSL